MKVDLINYTENAVELLILAKRTRRLDIKNTMDEISNMSDEDRNKELDYIFNTISGPWEFVDYTFLISGVTRAFTHELVRQRVGVSFAQESMRIANKEDFEYLDETNHPFYRTEMSNIQKTYSELISEGVPIQDARGILPTNILTKILMKINLRALNNMMNVRLCTRAAGEYQRVAREIRRAVLDVHPWADPVLLPFCVQNHRCRYPNHKDCPIKRKHSWLASDGIALSVKTEARETWEQSCCASPQPK